LLFLSEKRTFPPVFPYARRNTARRFKFHARQTSVHSPATCSKPRSENWRSPAQISRLKAQIGLQESMRESGIQQPDTHISPPPLGQAGYGLRPAPACPSG